MSNRSNSSACIHADLRKLLASTQTSTEARAKIEMLFAMPEAERDLIFGSVSTLTKTIPHVGAYTGVEIIAAIGRKLAQADLFDKDVSDWQNARERILDGFLTPYRAL